MSTTNLILKQLPRYPAHISGSNGIQVTVSGGIDLVVSPDYGTLVPVPGVTNPSMTYFMAWDRSINYYQSISFQDFADNLAGQVLAGTLVALRNVTFGADEGVYFSDFETAHAYSLSAFVRGISGSADASAFKTSLSLVKADVGLANVDNTSDAGKPVSTAQQTALDLKANLASPALTGTPTAPTAATATNTTQVATTAFVQAAIAALPAPFTKEYVSAQQTITSGGALTLSHGLAAVPKLVVFDLVCTVAENGFSVGDVVALGPIGTATSVDDNRAFVARKTATDILIRYGSAVQIFSLLNTTAGAGAAFTNTSWRLVARAYA